MKFHTVLTSVSGGVQTSVLAFLSLTISDQVFDLSGDVMIGRQDDISLFCAELER